MSRAPAALLVLLLAACGGDDAAVGDAGGTDGAAGADAGLDAGPIVFPDAWSLALVARSNFAENPGGAYRMPADHFLESPSIRVNPAGQVAFAVAIAPDGRRHVWLGTIDGGELVYHSPVDAFMSAVSLNASGRVVFDLTMTETEGVYFFDPAARPESGVVTTEPFGALGRGDPVVNDAGQIGFRAGFGDARAHYVLEEGRSSPAVRVAETGLDPGSPYSFLFSPAFGDDGAVAGQARRGPGTDDDRPDEIVLWPATGDPIVIARDADADRASPYAAFDASRVALDDRGQVAFIADLVDGGRAVVRSDGDQDTVIAREGDGEVGDIEFFSPDINTHGWVVFRAFDHDGLRAIWVGDGTSLVRVATEHDHVPSDLGDAVIDQETPDNPVFGGSPTIDDRGDVGFAAGLTPVGDDQIEWGTGVYVAVAQH